MALTFLKGSLAFKDTQGNSVQIASFTDADIQKIKNNLAQTSQNTSDIATLRNDLEASNRGQTVIAFKDYTQEQERGDMKEGYLYRVPFNKAGQYIKIDPNTYKPSASQAGGVTDTVVNYVMVAVKDSTGSVNVSGPYRITPDMAEYASLSGNNTFTGNNTFANDITITSGSAQELTSIGDTTVVAGKLVKELHTKVQELETANADDISISISESKPDEGSMQPNVIYGFNSTNLLGD